MSLFQSPLDKALSKKSSVQQTMDFEMFSIRRRTITVTKLSDDHFMIEEITEWKEKNYEEASTYNGKITITRNVYHGTKEERNQKLNEYLWYGFKPSSKTWLTPRIQEVYTDQENQS